jgi:hypothetical protein
MAHDEPAALWEQSLQEPERAFPAAITLTEKHERYPWSLAAEPDEDGCVLVSVKGPRGKRHASVYTSREALAAWAREVLAWCGGNAERALLAELAAVQVDGDRRDPDDPDYPEPYALEGNDAAETLASLVLQARETLGLPAQPQPDGTGMIR